MASLAWGSTNSLKTNRGPSLRTCWSKVCLLSPSSPSILIGRYLLPSCFGFLCLFFCPAMRGSSCDGDVHKQSYFVCWDFLAATPLTSWAERSFLEAQTPRSMTVTLRMSTWLKRTPGSLRWMSEYCLLSKQRPKALNFEFWDGSGIHFTEVQQHASCTPFWVHLAAGKRVCAAVSPQQVYTDSISYILICQQLVTALICNDYYEKGLWPE